MRRPYTEGDPHRYDDMLDMKRPVSLKHPPMSAVARAAQFAPFAALSGYSELIGDTDREQEDLYRLREEGILSPEINLTEAEAGDLSAEELLAGIEARITSAEEN